MFYRLDLKGRKITIVSSLAMEEESKYLHNYDYEFIFLSNVKAFIKQKEKLPDNSIFIALNEIYSNLLSISLPILYEENISIIIFLPITVSSNSNEYHEKAVQQLNEFIFSEEFKNIFSYAQPNEQLGIG